MADGVSGVLAAQNELKVQVDTLERTLSVAETEKRELYREGISSPFTPSLRERFSSPFCCQKFPPSPLTFVHLVLTHWMASLGSHFSGPTSRRSQRAPAAVGSDAGSGDKHTAAVTETTRTHRRTAASAGDHGAGVESGTLRVAIKAGPAATGGTPTAGEVSLLVSCVLFVGLSALGYAQLALPFGCVRTRARFLTVCMCVCVRCDRMRIGRPGCPCWRRPRHPLNSARNRRRKIAKLSLPPLNDSCAPCRYVRRLQQSDGVEFYCNVTSSLEFKEYAESILTSTVRMCVLRDDFG